MFVFILLLNSFPNSSWEIDVVAKSTPVFILGHSDQNNESFIDHYETICRVYPLDALWLKWMIF